MASRLRALLALFGVLAVLASPPSAQLPDAERRAQLERWNSLSHAERAEVERRFEVLRAMSSEERRALEERAHTLGPRRLGLAERVPEHLRTGLQDLSGPERRQALHDQLLEELRHEGRELRGLMPPELLEKLENAPGPRRPAILHAWHEKQREKGERRALRELGRALKRSEAEVEGLVGLSPQERRGALLSLSRELVEREVQRGGLPRGVRAEQFQTWSTLPDEAFLREYFRGAGLRPYWWLLGPERGQPTPPGPGPGSGQAVPMEPEQSLRWQLLDQLEGCLRPGWEALELRHMSRVQRARELRRRMRQRCLALIEEQQLLAPAELEALRALDDEQFAPRLQHLIQAERHRILGWAPPGAGRGPFGRRSPGEGGGRRGPASGRGPGGGG